MVYSKFAQSRPAFLVLFVCALFIFAHACHADESWQSYSTSMSYFVEPFSLSEIKKIQAVTERKDLKEYRAQLLALQYRYNIPGSEEELKKLLKEQNIVAASVFAMRKDDDKVASIIKAFLNYRPYDPVLTQLLGQWRNSKVLAALQEAFKRDKSNSLLALALARQQDRTYLKEIKSAYFNASEKDPDKVRLAVALCYLEPEGNRTIASILKRIVQSRKAIHPFDNLLASYLVIESASYVSDLSYRGPIVKVLQDYISGRANDSMSQYPIEAFVWESMDFFVGNHLSEDAPLMLRTLERLKDVDPQMKQILSTKWRVAEAVLKLNPTEGVKIVEPFVTEKWLSMANERNRLKPIPEGLLSFDNILASAIRPLLD